MAFITKRRLLGTAPLSLSDAEGLAFESPLSMPVRNKRRTARSGSESYVLVYVAIAIVALFYYKPLFGIVAFGVTLSILFVKRPALALATILAVTPIQNDMGNASLPVRFSLAELGLAIGCFYVFFRNRGRLIFGPTVPFSVLYLLVCVLCSLDNARETTYVSIMQMVVYLIGAVVLYANLVPDIASVVKGFDLYVGFTAIFSIAGMATNFSFLGIHKNGWGASISTALVAAIELWVATDSRTRRKWLRIAVGVLGIALVLTASRGGWLAAVTGLIVICIMRRRFSLLLRASLLLIPLLAIGWVVMPQDKQETAMEFDTNNRSGSLALRYASIEYAWGEFQKNPLSGTGVGLRKEYDATNIAMAVLAESGVIGFGAFFLVQVAIWYTATQASHRVRWSDPAASALVLAMALTMARLAHGMVDHYWSRGAITCAWAAVGMATLVYTRGGKSRQLRASA